jgi:cytochrome c oxidase subunit 2
VRRKALTVLGVVALAVLLAGCSSGATQDTLQPKGPYAQKLKDLFVFVFWIAVGVFVLVEGGIVYLLARYRHRRGRDRIPSQIHGNTRLEVGWTILPAIVLAFITVPTVAAIWDLASRPADAMHVKVTGRQWWWRFEYVGEGFTTPAGSPIVTANELVIPTGETVVLEVTADQGAGAVDDEGNPGQAVIHAFWIPELAGKQDAVPGRTTYILMEADEPGIYEGQCAEYCGLSHGVMRTEVRALAPDAFEEWVAAQKRDAVAPAPGSLEARGLEIVQGVCVRCHAIQGVPEAGADAGPDLTHFASRDCFAGCLLDNQDPEDIARWIDDPGAVKEGAKMPDYGLSPEDIEAVVAYLMSLE